MATFQLTRKAVADLKDIGRYTQSRWGREQRNKYLGELNESFLALARDPAKGKDSGHIRQGYRRYFVGRHVIYYRYLAAGRIEIVRILHDRMDPDRHFD